MYRVLTKQHLKQSCTKQSHISDKMTAEKTILCKFQNSGYCKYKERCRFKHVSEHCEGRCGRKTCRKRHQKQCRFGEKCRRQTTCEYKHQTTDDEESLKDKISILEATIKNFVEENKKKKAEMDEIELELKVSLKKVLKENKDKDNTISELKERLVEREFVNKELEKKLTEKVQEEKAEPREAKETKTKQNASKCGENLSGEDLFSCSECSKEFSQKSSLNIHIRKHIKAHLKDKKPFVCKLCKEEFKFEHEVTYNGQKCDFYCKMCKISVDEENHEHKTK